LVMILRTTLFTVAASLLWLVGNTATGARV
jgi:hypothetical protein